MSVASYRKGHHGKNQVRNLGGLLLVATLGFTGSEARAQSTSAPPPNTDIGVNYV
jgi:hypothetical protein